jgi:hypothetical protein
VIQILIKTEFGLYPGSNRNLKKIAGPKESDCSPMNGAPGGSAEGGCLGAEGPVAIPDRSAPSGCVYIVKWGAITTEVYTGKRTETEYFRGTSLPCEVLLYVYLTIIICI